MVLVGAVLVFWATAWTAGLWGISGLSWHFFEAGGRALLHDDGLSVYARHPELQVGPLSLLVAGVLDGLLGGHAEEVALALMAMTGPVLLLALSRVMHPERRTVRVLFAGLVVLPAWCVLAVRWGHLDDVLATACGVAAVVAARRRRPVWVGLALGAAIAAKPWAVGFLPVLLAPYCLRWRSVTATLAVAAAAWLPFLVGDSGTLAGLRPPVAVVPGSGLRTLGVRATVVPDWGRTVQLLLAPVVALLAGTRGRFAGVMLVALAVRLALDPQDNAYYVGSAAVAALVFDLLGTRCLVPWTTVLTVVALWQPFVADYPRRLATTRGLSHWWFAHPETVGWIHLGWVVVVVVMVLAWPRSAAGLRRARMLAHAVRA